MMDRVSQHSEQAIGNAVPLFSSSWVALYMMLRENLGRGPRMSNSINDSPKTGSVGRPH